jgi:hypothetical protein
VGGRRVRRTWRDCLVAIVDDGIDVRHEAFLDDNGGSRIVGIWDQADPDPAPAGAVAFGRLHTAEEIADYVRKNRAPHRLAGRGRHGPGDHAAARSAAKHQVNSIARGFGHPQCRVSYRLPLEGRIKSGPASSYGPPRSGVLRLVL